MTRISFPLIRVLCVIREPMSFCAIFRLVEDATMLSLHSVTDDEELSTLIDSANVQLAALGYTEHGRRHAGRVASVAGDILETL